MSNQRRLTPQCIFTGTRRRNRIIFFPQPKLNEIWNRKSNIFKSMYIVENPLLKQKTYKTPGKRGRCGVPMQIFCKNGLKILYKNVKIPQFIQLLIAPKPSASKYGSKIQALYFKSLFTNLRYCEGCKKVLRGSNTIIFKHFKAQHIFLLN